MLRSVFNAVALVALSVFWSTLALLSIPFSRTFGYAYVAPRWARWNARACGIDLEMSGFAGPFDAPAYVVMGNHTSHFDVIAMFACLPIQMRPVAKRQLAWIPIFGWALWAGAAIMIDRGQRKAAIRSIERAARTIRAGSSVVMFPEGTRTPPGELRELKKGPFHLALEAQVPVLPVGIIGTGAVLPKGGIRIRGGKVRVVVGTPIPTEGRTNDDAGRQALADEVRDALRVLMDDHALDRPRTRP